MRLLTFSLLLLLAPALAGAQNRQELQLMADMRMLQEQLARVQVSTNQLAEALARTNARIDEQAGSTVKGFADQQLLINNLSTTLNTVREKLDDNTVRVSQLTQELGAIRTGLSMLTEQLNALVAILQPPVPDTDTDTDAGATGPPAAQAPTDPASPASPAAGGLGAVNVPISPGRLFDLALTDYMSNRLDSAIEGFEDFVEQFPMAPDAARAQKYIGQSYYDQRRFKEAIAAFDKVIASYPDSDQVPEAYYLQGLCYVELGERATAEKTFEFVRTQFPGTIQAIQAEQKLKGMSVAR